MKDWYKMGRSKSHFNISAQPKHTAVNPFTHVKTLDNGAQYTSQHCPRSNGMLRASVLIRGGSTYDPAGKAGIAHLLEHMLITDDDENELTLRGGKVGLATSDEFIHIDIEIPNEGDNQELFFEIVSKALRDDIHDQAALDSEKRRVSNEIGMYHDMPDEKKKTLWAQHQHTKSSISFGALGSRETVNNLSLKELNTHKKNLFRGGNITAYFSTPSINALGKFRAETKKVLSENIKRGAVSPIKNTSNKKSFEIHETAQHLDQNYFDVFMTTKARTLKDKFTLELLSAYFDERMITRMQQQSPHLYETDSSLMLPRNPDYPDNNIGVFNLSGNVIPSDNAKILPALADIIVEAATNPDEDALYLAFNKVSKPFELQDEDYFYSSPPSDFAADIAYTGQILKPHGIMKLLNNIEIDDLTNAMRGIIKDENISLLTYGNNENFGTLSDLKAMIYDRLNGIKPPQPMVSFETQMRPKSMQP